MYKILYLQVISLFVLLVNAQDIGKLPYCLENSVPGLVLVSTIDGRFSAINSEGALLWQIETGPGPLLTSNIHNLELSNNGKWIRIIPSLTGTLYKFDGTTIDPIPISAESLLRSSFKYSNDLVIAGGLEIRTYGVGFRTGRIFYTCSTTHCSNNTDDDNKVDDILLIERSSQTVRAIDSQSGHERWNFSVGHHNIKLPQITCTDPNINLFNWNISAIIPDGLLLASSFQDNVEKIWQYHFPSPIVRVWKWNGHQISEIDLFSIKTVELHSFPAIYIGMHKKQLYIHESRALQHKNDKEGAIAESASNTKIPWKPISASGIVTEDDSTALSVLYSSEYVNGNGYYLFTESALKKKNSGLCGKNNTIKIPMLLQDKSVVISLNLIWNWWKEIIVIAITTAIVFNFMFKTFTHRSQQKKIIFVERVLEVPINDNQIQHNQMVTVPFTSRYMNDFVTLRCLGMGGFGVVFEVKQKIDECHYAIKRIVLPNEDSRNDTVMREVKALAKLEHNNIVRYFNSWVENPPYGWQQEHDSKWVENDEFSASVIKDSILSNSIEVDSNSSIINYKTTDISTIKTNDDDSYIVFDENSNGENSIKTNDTITSSFCTNSETAGGVDSKKINWRRPSRRHHSITQDIIAKVCNHPPVFLYIQMQLCQRKSLKDWLADNSVRNGESVLSIFKQIVSAVEYIHLQGLIHRDLKPSNIFFSLDGQIKVGDFGLVKDVEDCYDITSSSYGSSRGHTKEVGTRLYMSPEQLNGTKYSYKVDIYSLGLIFFELLLYFATDMERMRTISDVRENKFPIDFITKYTREHELLRMMLCQVPEKRLTTFGIRARPPISDNNDNSYDFELPKTLKNTLRQNELNL